MHTPEHPADPVQRRWFRWLCVGVVLLGLAGLSWIWVLGPGWMMEQAGTPVAAAEVMQTLTRGLLKLLGVQCLLLAGVLAWQGVRIQRAGCFPLPGARTVFRWRRRVGADARSVAGLAWLSALVLGMLGGVALWLGLR